MNGDIDLGFRSMLYNFSNRWLKAYGIVMVRTILAKKVSKMNWQGQSQLQNGTYEEKLLFEIERHDVVTMRRGV